MWHVKEKLKSACILNHPYALLITQIQMFYERLIAACKLLIVCFMAFIININVIYIDMYTPLLFGTVVLMVYGFLNPFDPHVQNLFNN
jgi:hypothetical protein